MSFLSNIANFGKKAIGFLSGDSIASSLVKTALLGYAVRKMSDNVVKSNNSGTKNIDQGVRLQVTPNADAKIPVLYGDAYFGGNITDAAMTNANKTMWYCLTLCESTGTKLSDAGATTYTFNDVYWNQQRIVFRADGITADYAVDKSGTIDRSISGLVRVYCYTGSSSSGVVPVGYAGAVPNADTIFPNWTAVTHPMQDLIFAVVRVDYNREKSVTGIADMLFQVESNMKQPGDVLYDYLSNTTYGVGIPTAEIDTTSLVALNTFSLESINYNDEATGPQLLADQYQINGLIDTAENVLSNAEQICSSAGSWLSYDTHEGLWRIVINEPSASVASFSDDNILGNISIGGTGLQDLYNSVKVEFPHRDLRDSADFVKIEIPSIDRNANEADNTLNIAYDLINEPVQAERLGFIELKQSRVDLVISFETDFGFVNLKAGDVIDVTNDRYAFTNKAFRIITITERQDDLNGALTMEIVALEYDADVYAFADITRFTRSDDDGIITIGSIGIPNIPQVTKFEKAARPRIEIEATSPTGVVEGIEYWITFDFNEIDDDLRSYSLIGTKRPVGGGTFASGTNVIFDYDNINAQNFYVKVRGFNTTTVGPFSDPSGLVEFLPQQTTDAVTPDTDILDGTGALATALGLITLLNSLDGLFSGDSAIGSLFDTVFGLFQDETGVDLVADALAGTLGTGGGGGGSTDITAYGRITLLDSEKVSVGASVGITESVTYLNSFGDVNIEFIASKAGASYVVLATKGTNERTPETPKTFDVFNQTSDGFTLNLGSASVGDVIHFAVIGTGEPGACILEEISKYPADRATRDNPLADGVGDIHPILDKPYIVYETTGLFNIATGSGNVFLYKSDGTLVETVLASAIQIVANTATIPFADFEYGVDYYILMEKNVIIGNRDDGETCVSPAITSPFTWNFHTFTEAELGAVPTAPVLESSLPPLPSNTVIPPPNFTPIPAECETLRFLYYTTQSKFNDSNNAKVDLQSNIRLHFNTSIKFGTAGNITIFEAGGAVWQGFDITDNFENEKVSELLWIEDNVLVINPTTDFDKASSYYLLISADCVINDCGIVGNEAISSSAEVVWTTDAGPDSSATEVPPAGESINRLGLSLPYDRPIEKGAGTIKIFDSGNNLVAEVPAYDPIIQIS